MDEVESTINPRILAGGKEFADYSQRFSKLAPHYVLDFSWPSVGLVDYYIQGLRGKENYNKVEEHVFLGASSYLSGLGFNCYRAIFPDSLVNVEFENKSISLELRANEHLEENEVFRIPLSSSLKQILSEPTEVLPYFAQSRIHTIPETNITSLFCYGLFSGLCPYGKGALSQATPEQLEKEIKVLNLLLAESSAHYYRANFPDESYGKNPALYAIGMIYPPAGHKEKFLFSNAAIGAVAHLLNLKATAKEVYQLGINLSKNPDETISSIGYILAVSSLDNDLTEIPLELEALADSFIERAPSLVPALIVVRDTLFSKTDWLSLLDKKEPESVIRMIEIEKQLSLIPTFKLKTKRVKEEKYHLLLKYIRLSESGRGRSEVDRLIEAGEATSDVILQGIAFDLYHNDLERAEQALKLFPKEYLAGDSELLAIYSELVATFYERTCSSDKAKEIIASSLQSNISDKTIAVKNYLFYSGYLIRENNWQEVIELSEKILSISPGSVSARINFYLALRMTNRDEEAVFLLEEIYRLSPLDRRVFGLVQSAFAS